METFSALLALYAGMSLVTGEFPHKVQWRGAEIFSLICTWINGWVNNRDAGDLRLHRAHHDVTVMGALETLYQWEHMFLVILMAKTTYWLDNQAFDKYWRSNDRQWELVTLNSSKRRVGHTVTGYYNNFYEILLS